MANTSGAACGRPLLLSGISLQALAYLGVSALALGCDTAVYLALARAGSGAALASAVGYGLGMLVHYLASKAVVFDARATGKHEARLLLEFVASGLAGLALTMAVVTTAVSGLGISLLPAKIAAVGISFVTVFLIRRFVVFASRGAGG